MKVYHGSSVVVAKPDLSKSKVRIDFGPGFYVTTFRDQAEKWSRRKALRKRTQAFVSEFELNESQLSGMKVKRFVKADVEWLDFVASCRRGVDLGLDYDVIIGPVADDAVYEAVNMYMTGLWDAKRTIEEVRYYKSNDQIVFKTADAVDRLLMFVRGYEVEAANV